MLAEKVIENATEAQVRTVQGVASALREWATTFPENELREAISALEQKRREIEDELELFQAALTAAEDLRAKANGNGHRRPPSKREAVLELLREQPDTEYKLSEIRSALIERGVMPDTDRASHALQMTVQNMFARYGEVDRPRPGFYKLAAPSGANKSGEISNATENPRQNPGEGRLDRPPLPAPNVEGATGVVYRPGP